MMISSSLSTVLLAFSVVSSVASSIQIQVLPFIRIRTINPLLLILCYFVTVDFPYDIRNNNFKSGNHGPLFLLAIGYATRHVSSLTASCGLLMTRFSFTTTATHTGDVHRGRGGRRDRAMYVPNNYNALPAIISVQPANGKTLKSVACARTYCRYLA